ncbi:MAG TPA: Ig-like domain-containing protein, partial [Gemmatimonadaceae bacterium]|nr:Ig-like domain-containing protein [Gemmatimonadaceae bacterium]
MRPLVPPFLVLLCLAVVSLPLRAQGAAVPLRGDVTGDGQITALDALAILSYTVGKSLPPEYTVMPNGDNNGDGQVTAIDALVALSFVVGRDVSRFPINTPLLNVASIHLSPSSAIVLVGQSAQLVATLRDSSGTELPARPITWTTSDAAIAEVDASGVVTARGIGVATITATADDATGSVAVAGDQLIASTVAAGSQHACALTATGAALCWGSNVLGQLGDGTTTDRTTPGPVSGGRIYKAIAVGEYNSCALTAEGAAYCWGDNSYGNLGDGTFDNRRVPTAVTGGRTFASLSAGRNWNIALTADGAAYTWGANAGTIGDGTTTNRPVPTLVSGGLTFRSVAAGHYHALGITTDGVPYAWGMNDYGQLGDGTQTKRTAPVPVAGGLNFRAVSGGAGNSFGITADGAAYAWGANDGQSLGIGASERWVLTPAPVRGGLRFRAIAAGGAHTIGLTMTGAAYAWGNNSGGQLGLGTTVDSPEPTLVSGGRVYRSVSAGQSLSLAQTHDGSVFAWGFNHVGQVGDGTTTNRHEPVAVGGTSPTSRVTVTPAPFAMIWKGGSATMQVSIARVGGYTGDVELGLDAPAGIFGTFSPAMLTGSATTSTLTLTASSGAPSGNHTMRVRARPVGRLDQFSSSIVIVAGSAIGEGAVAAGNASCGLTAAGAAYCWGTDLGTGTGTVSTLPVAVSGGHTFMAITSGATHACALTPAGAAYCWGDNEYGQLGDGGSEPRRAAPAAVAGGLQFRAISAGERGTCALTQDGKAYCWGENGAGSMTSSPAAVPGGHTFHSVSVGALHTIALTPAGEAYTWGDNSFYQIGTGAAGGYQGTPVRVGGALRFIAASAGGLYNAAITADGTPYTWGTGPLGHGAQSQTTQMVPTLVPDAGPYRAISAGFGGTVALSTSGQLWWWGSYGLTTGSIDDCMNGGSCGTSMTSIRPRSFDLSQVRSISAGNAHALVLTHDGVAHGWGGNLGGQLGDGTKTSKSFPTARDINYSIAAQSPLWLQPGQTVSTPVTITRTGGFTTSGIGFPGDIGFGISGSLPTGVTAAFSPATASPSVNTTTLSFTATSGAAPGPVSFAVRASSPGATDRSASMSVIVPTPKPAAGYDLVCP